MFKSTDGGNTWKAVNTGLPNHAAVAALAIAPTMPGTLYAGTNAISELPSSGVFKSTNGATTWQATGFVAGPICGDGIRTCEEQCEDGNTLSGDGCDANCTLTRCGNGILTTGEECDDGNIVSCDGCSGGCQIETGGCGDGVLDANCEQCDDAIPTTPTAAATIAPQATCRAASGPERSARWSSIHRPRPRSTCARTVAAC